MASEPTLHASSIAPQWMSAEQAAAFARGLDHAAAASTAATSKPDSRRIDLEQVVSFRCPPYLTLDYDPTYRPAVR